MRRIVFSIAFFRQKLSVQSTPTSTKSRWKFYTQLGHRSFHTGWVKNGSVRARAARPVYPPEQTPGMSAWCPYSRAAQACRGAKRSGLSRASPIKAQRRQADRPMCWASKSAVPLPIEDVDSFATSRQAKKTPSEGLISNGASSRAGGARRHTALMRSAAPTILPPVTISYLPGTGLRMDDESRDILPVEQPHAPRFGHQPSNPCAAKSAALC